MRILSQLCAIPTAPFLEQRVVEYVRQFVRARRRLRLSCDEHGNLLIELPGRRKGLPRWIFAAHIDHPGFAARGMVDKHTLEADFRGYVLADFVKGTKVRFFDGGREIPGKVIDAKPDKDSPRTRVVRVKVAEEVPPGSLGMFDLVPARTQGKLFHSRAIDDLGGAASALAMLDQLHRDPPASPVAVLLTRAEEEGFIGAIAACIRPRLLRRSDRIISIECSAMQPYAPQGKGPIIRVGDKTSIFNSALTFFLTHQAEALSRKSRGFTFQRALMPGGTCEATVYDAYGYQSAAMCVALGNYHNMDRDRHRIAAEYINVADWQRMVKLFVAVARNAQDYREGHRALRQRVEARFRKARRLLASTACEPRRRIG